MCQVPEDARYPVCSVVVAVAQVFALAQVWRRCLLSTRAKDCKGTAGGYSPNGLLQYRKHSVASTWDTLPKDTRLSK